MDLSRGLKAVSSCESVCRIAIPNRYQSEALRYPIDTNPKRHDCRNHCLRLHSRPSATPGAGVCGFKWASRKMGCEQMNSVRYFLVYLALACVAPAASGGEVAGGRAVAVIEPPGANPGAERCWRSGRSNRRTCDAPDRTQRQSTLGHTDAAADGDPRTSVVFALASPPEARVTPLAAHFLVDVRPIRPGTCARRPRRRSRREQKTLQRPIVEIDGQGPPQARHAGVLEIGVHLAVAERHRTRDHALAQPALELQT